MACGNIRKTATLLVNSVVIRNRAEHRRKESNRALLGRLDCNGGKKIRAYERFALRLSPRSIIIVNFQTDQPYSPATLSRPVVHLRNSEPVLGRTIPAELGLVSSNFSWMNSNLCVLPFSGSFQNIF